MAFKLVIFAAFVAIAQAGLIPQPGYASSYSTSSLAHAAPQLSYAAAPAVYAHAQPVAKVLVQEAPANYQFAYAVSDPHTGDVKEQQEARQGDVVQGSYSLLEADGTRRVVHYSADPHNGFNAVVERQGTPVVAKVATVAKVAAPVAYAAPQLSHGYYH